MCVCSLFYPPCSFLLSTPSHLSNAPRIPTCAECPIFLCWIIMAASCCMRQGPFLALLSLPFDCHFFPSQWNGSAPLWLSSALQNLVAQTESGLYRSFGNPAGSGLPSGVSRRRCLHAGDDPSSPLSDRHFHCDRIEIESRAAAGGWNIKAKRLSGVLIAVSGCVTNKQMCEDF